MKVEEGENFIKRVMDDTQSIIRATKITPSKIYYYVATPWKWKLFLRMLEKAATGKLETDTSIGELLKEPELRKNAKEVVKIIPKIAEENMKMSDVEKKRQLSTGALNEYEILENAKGFLKEELRAEVDVFEENDSERYDPKQRARLAKPYRPAIFIE